MSAWRPWAQRQLAPWASWQLAAYVLVVVVWVANLMFTTDQRRASAAPEESAFALPAVSMMESPALIFYTEGLDAACDVEDWIPGCLHGEWLSLHVLGGRLRIEYGPQWDEHECIVVAGYSSYDAALPGWAVSCRSSPPEQALDAAFNYLPTPEEAQDGD